MILYTPLYQILNILVYLSKYLSYLVIITDMNSNFGESALSNYKKEDTIGNPQIT